jgi:membrane protein DedA with SNARE-associated domain
MPFAQKFLSAIDALPNILAYLLLGLCAFGENLFPPVPGDTITAFGAFLVGTGKLSFAGVYASTTLGSFLGFLTLFSIGGFLGRHFFIEKDYRFLRARDIIKAEAWFSRYGYFLIAFNRFLPGIRSAISVAGGISRLKLVWVALLSLASCGAWNLIWIMLGFSLGSRWDLVESRMSEMIKRYNIAILVIISLLFIGFFLWKRYRKHRS